MAMITLSIKVADGLHRRLEQQLKATGQSRSAFIRELIERELRSAQERRPTVADHPLMRFKGVIEGTPGSRQDALRVGEILAGEGYGDDGADS